MSFAEKRRHPRLSIYFAALAVCAGEGYLSDVRDLSQSGACIGRPKNWPVDAPAECRVFFIFDQETVIGLNARIARSGSADIGLEFLPGQETRIETLLYESRFAEKDSL